MQSGGITGCALAIPCAALGLRPGITIFPWENAEEQLTQINSGAAEIRWTAESLGPYSTVTLLARLRGRSTSVPFNTATW